MNEECPRCFMPLTGKTCVLCETPALSKKLDSGRLQEFPDIAPTETIDFIQSEKLPKHISHTQLSSSILKEYHSSIIEKRYVNRRYFNHIGRG